MSTYLLVAVAMFAFAANSILCRLALAEGSIDAGSFTLIRIFSGAITLALILLLKRNDTKARFPGFKFSLMAGSALFVYAILFSYAYIQLAAGTGALLLFGAVQLSLLILHWWQGERFKRLEVIGIGCSIAGFVWLMLPSATRPDLFSALLMIFSGVSWALFTALGKKVASPSSGITWGFMSASAIGLLISPLLVSDINLTAQGILLAITSGAIASALGYILWYRVLKNLSLLQASISQLSVPVITLVIGSVLLGESLSMHSVLTSSVILGGIALVFLARSLESNEQN
ncbi:DMT family transporter [Vibrio hepatarius]|uniref:DMT family transporter n=1 Tax=Vibrio hepatarius TaxID=171383 RepID=UPI00142E871B|nr:DMT family transporter [Vibrio hepatarius]NIY83748.1 DMT family transporter [Vibrio hepatarius]